MSGGLIVRAAHGSHEAMWRSVPQIPVLRTRIRTSSIPIVGSGTSHSSRPGPGAVLTSAFMRRPVCRVGAFPGRVPWARSLDAPTRNVRFPGAPHRPVTLGRRRPAPARRESGTPAQRSYRAPAADVAFAHELRADMCEWRLVGAGDGGARQIGG